MTDEPILLNVEDGIATITLNRPEAGNAINLLLAKAMFQAALKCEADPAIRCVVLTAKGRLFCAGGDLGDFATAGANIGAYLAELAGTLHMAVARLMRMRKPLLVLVNGPAAGAGLSLALMGDMVIAGRAANFSTAYGGVGLSPDGGASWMLPRLVGMRLAQEMIIANRRLSAEEAEAHGLITAVVDDAELVAEGQKRAARLNASAVGAIGAARALLLESIGGGFEAHLDLELRSIAERGTSAECREGVAAFLEKRKPDFKNVG